MRKKILALLMVIALTFSAAGCGSLKDATGGSDKGGSQVTSSSTDDDNDGGNLQLFKSDVEFTPEEKALRIKSEYLRENGGYSDDDEIVAILSLPDESVLETYSESESNLSASEYVSSFMGENQANKLAKKQQSLISDLYKRGLIFSVEYTYRVAANAVAVKTNYANYKLMKGMTGDTLSALEISDTYTRPQEAAGASGGAVENEVEVYADTGIYNASDVEDGKYTGKHTAIAILDSGFDMSHQVFLRQPEGELLLSKQTISEKVAVNGDHRLNAKQTTPDLTVGDVYYSEKIPYAYDYCGKDADVFPHDSEHGTHVAGIIGGWYEEENHRGVARDTQLVLMKVFPDDSSVGAETHDILAALDDAIILGVDAINMSLGASCGFAEESVPDDADGGKGSTIDRIYNAVEEAGISLVVAASNSYSSAYGGAAGNKNKVTNPDSATVGTPSTYPSALSVASISGVKTSYLVANGSDIIFFSESANNMGDKNDFFKDIEDKLENSDPKVSYVGSKDANGAYHLEYVTVPGIGENQNYNAIRSRVAGRIAVVRRGTNSFEEKAMVAEAYGAIGIIVYNNVEGEALPMSLGNDKRIPAVSITKADGLKLTAKSQGSIVLDPDNKAGPFISDFSSWGPMPDLTLKPEITAHGGDIRSSVPGGEYDQLSGTSMATPNLAGLMVLIRQYVKEHDLFKNLGAKEQADVANQLMMSTATVAKNEEGNPVSPRKQGAGLASLKNLVASQGYLTAYNKEGKATTRSKLELLDDPQKKGVYVMEFDVVNISTKQASYDISLTAMTESVSTTDRYYVAEKAQLLSNPNITLEKTGDVGTLAGNRVTVPAASATEPSKVHIKLTYTLSQADKDLIDKLFPNGMYVEGYLKLNAVEEGGSMSSDMNMPFLAFYGDWTRAPLFDKTYYEVEAEAHNNALDEDEKLKADYYATTPFGVYYYNYIIPLGTYLYDYDTTTYGAIPASEDKIALSNHSGTIEGIMGIYAGLLRNAKTVDFTITDKLTGEVIYTHTKYNLQKAFSMGGDPIPAAENLRIYSSQLGLVNNHEYEFEMFAKLDYGGGDNAGGVKNNLRNSFKFDFTLDEEAPIITNCTYEKKYDNVLRKDRYYINATVHDNQYAMSVQPMAMMLSTDEDDGMEYISSISQMSPLPIPVIGEKGGETTVRFEITDYLEAAPQLDAFNSAIAIVVDDYALNQAIYFCQLPGTNPSGDANSSGFKFTKDGKVDGTTFGTIAFNVEEDEVIDLTGFLATDDPTVDADRDYIKNLNWMIWDTEEIGLAENDIGEVHEGIFHAKTGGYNVPGEIIGTEPVKGVVTILAYDDMYGRSAAITLLVIKKGTANKNPCPASLGFAANARITDLKFIYLETKSVHQSANGNDGDLGVSGTKIYTASLAGGTDKTVNCYPGESFIIRYKFSPWYAEPKYTLTFRTNDESKATVVNEGENKGLVEAKAKGRAQITLNVDGSTIRARLDVNVMDEFVIEGTTLVAYKGAGGAVEIPADKSIVTINSFAFSAYTIDHDIEIGDDDDPEMNRTPFGNTTVTSVKIPEGVKVIGNYAFYGCSALQSVELPSTIEFIYKYAFAECKELETVTGFEEVEAIGMHCFENCEKLQSANICKAYAVGEAAFKNCKVLNDVNITALRNCGASAFEGCAALSNVTFDQNGNTKLSVNMFKGTALASLTIHARIAGGVARETIVPSGAFADCTHLTEVTLPDGEVSFGTGVFAGCSSLATAKFGKDTLIVSGTDVFNGTIISTFDVNAQNTTYHASQDNKLLLNTANDTVLLAAPGADFGESYSLPENVKTISAGAFSGANLKTLVIPGDITIGDYAFAGSNITTLTLPATGNIIIGNHAFDSSKLETVTNLDKAQTIGTYAFANTALSSVTVGGDVGERAFSGCEALMTVTVNSGATIGAYAFENCKLLSTVTLPTDGVTLDEGAFYRCEALETVENLDKVQKIPAYAFAYCSKLAAADLTAATEIGDYAFLACEKLASVTLQAAEKIGAGAFSGVVKREILSITDGDVPPEIVMPPFSDLPGASLGANEGGFYGYTSLVNVSVVSAPIFTEINLPESLTTLGSGAFYGASKLQSITLPANIAVIPDYAFAYTGELGTVNVGSATEIGAHAFEGSGVNEIDLSKFTKIGDSAFENYTRLASVDLAAAQEIGDRAFYLEAYVPEYEDDGLGEFVLKGTKHIESTLTGEISAPALKTIGDSAFAYSKITAFSAPLLESIGASAFNETLLTGFTFGEHIKKVGAGAFYNCTKLLNYVDTNGDETVELNDYASLDGGVLYTTEKNGNIILNSVPGGKNVKQLTVKEGTVRVEAYCGSANGYVQVIILPDSLKSVGSFAFYGYAQLSKVEFRSMTAPTLDDVGDSSKRLTENDPGYAMLHKYFFVMLGGSYERTYCNFVGLLGTVRGLRMQIPAGDGVTGYDSLIYNVFFRDGVSRSNYVAMENNMRTFVERAREVMAIIGEQKTYSNLKADDETIVTQAITAYNAMKGDYKKYGYTEAQWNEMYNCVLGARDYLSELRLANASWYARDVQQRMNALPDSYDGSDAQKQAYLQLTADYRALSRDDSDALTLTQYNTFRASYEAYSSGGGTVTPPDDDDDDHGGAAGGGGGGGSCSGCGSQSVGDGFGIGGAAILFTGLCMVAAKLVKRRKSQN